VGCTFIDIGTEVKSEHTIDWVSSSMIFFDLRNIFSYCCIYNLLMTLAHFYSWRQKFGFFKTTYSCSGWLYIKIKVGWLV